MDHATGKCIATCEEFSVEDTYPAPPRPNPAGAAATAHGTATAQPDEATKAQPPAAGVLPDKAGGSAAAAAKMDAGKPPSAAKAEAGVTASAAKGSVLAGAAGPPDRPAGKGKELASNNSLKHGDAPKGAMAARTLMFFKGCPSALGCTVLLKGASREALVAVKKIMQVRHSFSLPSISVHHDTPCMEV